MKKRKNRIQLYKRVASLLLVLAFTFNSIAFDGMFSFVPKLTVQAASDTYTPAIQDSTIFATRGTAFANNDSGKRDFLDFCYCYAQDDSFAQQYQGATVSVSFIEFPSDFSGFGNATYPFKGDFRIQDTGNYNVKLPCALFTHVYDSAKITNASGNALTLKIVKTSDASSALVAEHVYHDNAGTPQIWDITAASANVNSYAGVIGTMEGNAKLTIAYLII